MDDEDVVHPDAMETVENNGIVFIDEIDKITARSERMGGDVSREGVQRDLLPLIEGTTVSTKHGTIKTDHILLLHPARSTWPSRRTCCPNCRAPADPGRAARTQRSPTSSAS